MFMEWKSHIIKMSMLPKVSQNFETIPIKIPIHKNRNPNIPLKL